jgi:hypothetical protein
MGWRRDNDKLREKRINNWSYEGIIEGLVKEKKN